jgi:hypothetical protein
MNLAYLLFDVMNYLIIAFLVLVVGYVIIGFIIDFIKALAGFIKHVYKRIRGSYDFLDLFLVFGIYFIMLWWALAEIPTGLRIPAYIIITVTALYACAEKKK